jgi:hypothetical protein
MSRLLINEPPLQVLPSLAVKIGLNEALVLQQLHYWMMDGSIGVVKDGRKWIYNTYEKWHKNFPFWSHETIRKIFKSLRDQGLIDVRQLSDDTRDKTNYYTINLEAIKHLEKEANENRPCGGFYRMDTADFTASLYRTETTSETSNTGEISPNGSESGDSTFQLTAPKSPQSTQVPHESIVALWAKHLPSARQPIKWHASRQSALRSRWREDEARQSLTWWDGFFQYIARIDFLMGRTSAQDRTPFVITIDWVLELKNFTKILEGVYER